MRWRKQGWMRGQSCAPSSSACLSRCRRVMEPGFEEACAPGIALTLLELIADQRDTCQTMRCWKTEQSRLRCASRRQRENSPLWTLRTRTSPAFRTAVRTFTHPIRAGIHQAARNCGVTRARPGRILPARRGSLATWAGHLSWAARSRRNSRGPRGRRPGSE